MIAKSVLVRPQGLRPGARAPTYSPCYATAFGGTLSLKIYDPTVEMMARF